MKKLLSSILVFGFAVIPVCANCSAVSAQQASIEQLAFSALNTTDNDLKDYIMDELATRDAKDIENAFQDGITLVSQLENKLAKLKTSRWSSYNSVQKAEAELSLIKGMQNFLSQELYRRMPWHKYLFKKSVDVVSNTVTSGAWAALAGTISTVALAPFFGFNVKSIAQTSLGMSLSTAIDTTLSDISSKFGNNAKYITSMVSSLIGSTVASKVFPNVVTPTQNAQTANN